MYFTFRFIGVLFVVLAMTCIGIALAAVMLAPLCGVFCYIPLRYMWHLLLRAVFPRTPHLV